METRAGSNAEKPHAVCVPFPAQGHINPMLKLAKLLYVRGFHVTFVNTEFNHRRLLRSRGPHALSGLPSFQFETIPDGLPESDMDATQDIPALSDSIMNNFLAPFRELLLRINASGGAIPPVSCILSDSAMGFTIDAAEEIGVPGIMLRTTNACTIMLYLHNHQLIQKGLAPLREESGLDTQIHWIPSIKNLQLRDFPSILRTTDPHDKLLKFALDVAERTKRASAIVINTFQDLEHDVIMSMRSLVPRTYPIGPLQLMSREIDDDSEIGWLGSNLWKEETQKCMAWLDEKSPRSVVYVNFGSITVLTEEQLLEFAWGLAGSGKTFLWVVRPDLVSGETVVFPPEFMAETGNRGMMMIGWCPQEKVLMHPSIGAFLTHGGWNSVLESISGGVPMMCWPFFADQPTNCKFCCDEWGVGMKISEGVKREEVEEAIKEMMDGEKGKKMRQKAEEWRRLAENAVAPPSGVSFVNLDTVINEVILSSTQK